MDQSDYPNVNLNDPRQDMYKERKHNPKYFFFKNQFPDQVISNDRFLALHFWKKQHLK